MFWIYKFGSVWLKKGKKKNLNFHTHMLEPVSLWVPPTKDLLCWIWMNLWVLWRFCWRWPTCGGQQWWGPPSRDSFWPIQIFGIKISCARMACFPSSHSSVVPVREGTDPTHGDFSFMSPGPFLSPSDVQWARSQRNSMEKSYHRSLKKLSFSVGSAVYQLCRCGHVVSSSWLIPLHLQHDRQGAFRGPLNRQ